MTEPKSPSLDCRGFVPSATSVPLNYPLSVSQSFASQLTPTSKRTRYRRPCVSLQHTPVGVTQSLAPSFVFFPHVSDKKKTKNIIIKYLEKNKLVNPGFAGGATAESLIRASFSPDGRFVVSGSEKGHVRVWEAQEGKRVRTPLQVCM